MSPVLKHHRPVMSSPIATGGFAAGARLPMQERASRAQQVLIESRYLEEDPDVPALPGAAAFAILISASVASWFAVIMLIRALFG